MTRPAAVSKSKQPTQVGKSKKNKTTRGSRAKRIWRQHKKSVGSFIPMRTVAKLIRCSNQQRLDKYSNVCMLKDDRKPFLLSKTALKFIAQVAHDHLTGLVDDADTVSALMSRPKSHKHAINRKQIGRRPEVSANGSTKTVRTNPFEVVHTLKNDIGATQKAGQLLCDAEDSAEAAKLAKAKLTAAST